MQQPKRFVWIDCEMTGLDATKDLLLEVALIITDGELNELAQGPDIVIHQSQEALDRMHPEVQRLHTASGLTQQVLRSTVSVQQAEEQLLATINEHCAGHQAYLAGNSIWQDAQFLRRYMPRVMQQVHYRMLDVSSLKLIVQAWYHEDPHAQVNKKKSHRALDDIRESIAELQRYRTYFFKKPDLA
jgi:oligoribonuclease